MGSDFILARISYFLMFFLDWVVFRSRMSFCWIVVLFSELKERVLKMRHCGGPACAAENLCECDEIRLGDC